MNTAITGLQWGDEGKGKIVDFITRSANFVVRGQGGNNAGHTVIVGGTKYVLHLVPSGILWPGKVNVIGNGVVMEPLGLVREIRELEEKNVAVTPDNLLLSDRAQVVLPYHRGLDYAQERARGPYPIGTTGRGIGPGYADKASRHGLRLADLLDEQFAATLIELRLEDANRTLRAAGFDTCDPGTIIAELQPALERLRPHITNTIPVLHEAWRAGKDILWEGAQGTLLDIDFGTYPFVTSSNTTAGGACTGSGLPPTAVDRVVGVCKAYTTRVGGGPFVTEDGPLSHYLHSLGREFGATTNRKRRCGWLDSVLLRFACMVNGVTDLAVTNLDGLDSHDEILICTAYRINGREHLFPPAERTAWDRAEPCYESHPGWRQETSSCRSWDQLPANARRYLDRLAELAGAPLKYIGIGAERDQTILL